MVDPACMAAILTAQGYVTEKTEEWPVEQIRACIQDPRTRELDDAINTQAQAGNLKGTQAACRAWWLHVLAFAPVEVSA